MTMCVCVTCWVCVPSPEGSETLQSSLRSRAASSRTCCMVFTPPEKLFSWSAAWHTPQKTHSVPKHEPNTHETVCECVCVFSPCCSRVSVCPDLQWVSWLHWSACAGRCSPLSDPERDGRVCPPTDGDPVPAGTEHRNQSPLNYRCLNTKRPLWDQHVKIKIFISGFMSEFHKKNLGVRRK